MTEFISRKYGNDGYEIIIKTDSEEHYKASEDFARRLIDHAKPVTDNNVGHESLNIIPKVPGTWEEWWPGDCALIMTGEEKLYRCSICDAKYPDVEGFNFCPHCGNPIDSKSIHAKLPSNPTVRSYEERNADG